MPELKGSDGISWHCTIKGERKAEVNSIDPLNILKDLEDR